MCKVERKSWSKLVMFGEKLKVKLGEFKKV